MRKATVSPILKGRCKIYITHFIHVKLRTCASFDYKSWKESLLRKLTLFLIPRYRFLLFVKARHFEFCPQHCVTLQRLSLLLLF